MTASLTKDRTKVLMLKVCFFDPNSVVNFQEAHELQVEASATAYCVTGIEDLTLVRIPINSKAHFSNYHLCISYPFLSCLVISLV